MFVSFFLCCCCCCCCRRRLCRCFVVSFCFFVFDSLFNILVYLHFTSTKTTVCIFR